MVGEVGWCTASTALCAALDGRGHPLQPLRRWAFESNSHGRSLRRSENRAEMSHGVDADSQPWWSGQMAERLRLSG